MNPKLFCGLLIIIVASLTQARGEERGRGFLYPSQLGGATTASGEVLGQGDFTAAHATHPYGTILRVTNLLNGKAVNVRVNDRPSHRSQLVRLTHAAAAELEMLKHGVTDVHVVAVGRVREGETERNGLFGLFRPKSGSPSTGTRPTQGVATHAANQGMRSAGTTALVAAAPPVAVPYVAAKTAEPVLRPLAASTQQRAAAASGAVPPSMPVNPQVVSPAAARQFWLQFASFPDFESARSFANLIATRGAPTRVVSDPGGGVHRVVSDHVFGSQVEAAAAAQRTAQQVGYHSVIHGR